MPHIQTRPSTSPQSLAGLMAALIVGGITAIIDTTIVAIGLHTLIVQLHASVSTIQWVSTGYLLALAIAIPFVSWAQEKFGGKRLWLFALGLFVLGSAACAGAWNVDALIVFRILQGLGAGIMMPLMQTLVVQNIDREHMTTAIANVSLPAALGPILGPVLGGVVLNWLSWHWLFLINVPIGVVGWVLAFRFINDDHPSSHASREHLDVLGGLLLAPALAGLLYGLSNVYADGGFARADVLIPGVGGAVLLVCFAIWAIRRHDAALVDVRLLAVRSVRISSVALAFAGAALFAANFLLPLYFQSLRGYSVLDAAFLLIPQGVGAFLARFIVGRLVERFGSRFVTVVGSLVMAAATMPFAFADASSNLWILGVALFIRGIGQGVVLIPIMTVAYVDIGKKQMPHASAITRIAQQVGGSFGTALVAVILTSQATQTHPATGFQAAFWGTIAMTAVVAIAGTLLPQRSKAINPPAAAQAQAA